MGVDDMQIRDSLVAEIEKMPPFPQSFHRLLAITYGSPDEARDMVEVIMRDPVITFKLLRLANSAFFGLAREVATVERAMAVMGPNAIRNMMIAMSALGVMQRKCPSGFSIDQYLLHSLVTAAIARQLAQHLGDTSPLEAYLAGLLHDFGQVLCAVTFPDAVAQAQVRAKREGQTLCMAEEDAFGLDHAALGALLARHWQLPERLAAAIEGHHQPPPDHGLGRCLFLANQLAKRMSIEPDAPAVEALPPELVLSLGRTYEDIIAALPKLELALAEAESFLAAGR
jgi:putative nucleotidyltransferase with HDIG domain